MKTIAIQLNNLFTRSELVTKTRDGVLQIGPMLIINTMLLAAGALLILYYITGANGLASGNYKIKLLNDKLSLLNDKQSALMSQKSGLEDSLITPDFAKSHNMVEAKNISYIFESRNVAQR